MWIGFVFRYVFRSSDFEVCSYSSNVLGGPQIFFRAALYSTPGYKHSRGAMIEVSGLTKRYAAFTAVTDLSFSVKPGEVMGLVGPNGAGKTSTLRCLAGIIPPSAGIIHVCGHDLATNPVAAKRELAFFPDEPRLFEYLTVWQHLAFVSRVYHVANWEASAQPLLEELEIADKANALPGELSRGMKQKLAIACGLIHSPRVIFLDEPLTGLDPIGIRRMKDTILRRAREGAAILLSSHLLHLLEEVCTHVLIIALPLPTTVEQPPVSSENRVVEDSPKN